MTKLTEALWKLPPNFYLKCAVEKDPEDGHQFLSAVLMEEPPDGGWTSPDAYFGGTGYVGGEERIRPWKFDDACRVGVTVETGNRTSFERLVIGMIESTVERRSQQEAQ